MVLMLAGCTARESSQVVDSTNSCANPDCDGVTIVEDRSAIVDALELWGFPPLSVTELNEGEVLILVGAHESADCHVVITDVDINNESDGSTVELGSDVYGKCEKSDLRGRSFLLRVEASPPVTVKWGDRVVSPL